MIFLKWDLFVLITFSLCLVFSSLWSIQEKFQVSVFCNWFLPVGTCGNPGSPTNGARTTTGTSPGDTVIWTCNRGYRLVGSRSAECQPRGTWSRPLPICEGRWIAHHNNYDVPLSSHFSSFPSFIGDLALTSQVNNCNNHVPGSKGSIWWLINRNKREMWEKLYFGAKQSNNAYVKL